MFAVWVWLCVTVGHARDVIAVTTFDAHSIRPEIQPLGLGLADMLVTDLQRAPEVQVVERTRLNEVLNEFSLLRDGYLDEATAAKVGRGLGANAVVTGSITIAIEGMRLDARVVDVESGTVRGAVSVSGPEDTFFALEQELATRLLAELGHAVEVPVRDLTLDQAVLAARQMAERDADYLKRLDGIRQYRVRRLKRDGYQYTTGGANGQPVQTGITWTIYDGGGAWIQPSDFARRIDDPDLADLLERQRKKGKTIYWGGMAAVGGVCAGLGGVSLATKKPEYGYAALIGMVGVLVPAYWGAIVVGKTTRHTDHWTPDEADAGVDRANKKLATELGLSEADRLNAEVTSE